MKTAKITKCLIGAAIIALFACKSDEHGESCTKDGHKHGHAAPAQQESFKVESEEKEGN